MKDSELLSRFEAGDIPRPEWTHRAHVRIGYLYLQNRTFEEALLLVREGIKHLNAKNCVPEGPTEGYNETTTRAFLHLIAATIAAYSEAMPTVDSDAFCDVHPQLMSRNVLRFFYSPQRRMHPAAKYEFVEPDLTGLPRIGC